MTKNKNSTRYYSDIQEETIAHMLNGVRSSNSGAAKFSGGDVKVLKASLLIECKTVLSDKDSISIKKDWIEKNNQEKFSQRLSSGVIAFNFGPNQPNYFVIDSKLMRFLVEKLSEENK